MVSNNVLFENAELRYRNFAGREGPFNSQGDRNFVIVLDPKRADQLEAEGWNVKSTKPDENDEVKRFIQVSVNYEKGRPPRVVLINSKGRMDLGAGEVDILDYMDVANWDITVNPYAWNVGDNSGIKAYLKQAFVTVEENEFDRKYADLPDANPTSRPSMTASDEEVV